uniref:Sphingomyelin synthase-like domain-containing protein n=1 Tax=Alexandrium catenella TaxID=2925 RepID=A0A7S1WB09_ALECA|mmetsp:Transcript_46264/g.124272  ORF Transcript_46264/g.124272 Transcript_46264/m.124272 type:complete len:656 (+) Transcript_46264:85-2052(+)
MAPLEGKQGGSFRLQPGCSGPGWRYSRVPPCEAAPGSSSAKDPSMTMSEAAVTREDTRVGSSSISSQTALLMQQSRSRGDGTGHGRAGPVTMLGWAGPAVCLLGALFLQNAGVYSATGTYIRWMDELSKASQSDPSGGYVEAFAFEDLLAGWFEKLRFLDAPDVPWLAEAWVDVATGVLSLAWLSWVVRAQDVSLWTRSMLSGAVLALLKGLLAWGTVLPDPAGWHGCQERLGEDGLAYFRETASGTGGTGPGQALLDILLLELRSLWVLDRSGRRRVCADTIFSGQACFCMILCAGLYDAVRSATNDLEAPRKLALRGLALAMLGLALLAGLARAVAGCRHYGLDVLVALALAPLAFGSSAVALATNRWVSDWATAAPGLPDDPHEHDAAPMAHTASMFERHHWLFRDCCARTASEAPAALTDADAHDRGLCDLGECSLPPCCTAFSGGGVCFLRGDPGVPGLTPWTEECELRYTHQLAEFKEILAREVDRQQKAEGEIAREHQRVREFSQQLEERRGDRMQAELNRLATAEQGAIKSAKQELEAARASAAKLEEVAASQAKKLMRVETDFKMRKSQLTGSAKKYQRKTAEASTECAEYEQRIHASEQQLEAMQKLFFRHVDLVGGEPCEEPAGPDVPSIDAKTEDAEEVTTSG